MSMGSECRWNGRQGVQYVVRAKVRVCKLSRALINSSDEIPDTSNPGGRVVDVWASDTHTRTHSSAFDL